MASVLIEKPACGDFLPILDGGFSLQYSPLMEYREGRGLVLFCQADVTGRTESDPAAELLVRNLFRYVIAFTPPPRRTAVCAGDAQGRQHLESAGVSLDDYQDGTPSANQVLILSSGSAKILAPHVNELAKWLNAGGHLVAIGLNQDEANAILPFKVRFTNAEHISSFFEPFGLNSLLAGIGPADVHNRDPRELPLVAGGAEVIGDGILARAENANVIFLQLEPWSFGGTERSNIRRTYRRSSFLLSRLLANMGVISSTPLLARFAQPLHPAKTEKRWLTGFYLDQPQEWDDPYRFFRW